MKKTLAAVVAIMLCAAIYSFLGPVYSFKAHQGKVPLSPFGWHTLPDNAPETMKLGDPAYARAAEAALDILQRHRQRIAAPAMTAAVAIDGELVWSGAVGWSDIATGRSATTDTVFRIGSTSKIITATVLARLYERGVVALDTPIGEYFSTLPNEAWQPITLRHLASHQSGLPHYKENADLAGLYDSIALKQRFNDVRDAVSVFDGSDLLFAPGSDFHYSTLGTVLLGATLSHATGTAYRQLVATEILQPLELDTIAVAPRSARGAPDLATSYYVDDNRYRRWRPVDMTHRLPGGGFASTSRDLAMLGVAWLDESYLKEPTRRVFWSPQRLASGDINAQNYALGFRVSEWASADGVRYVHANHGGVSRGAQSWLMILPELRLALAINTNRKTEEFAEFGSVYRELLEVFVAPR